MLPAATTVKARLQASKRGFAGLVVLNGLAGAARHGQGA